MKQIEFLTHEFCRHAERTSAFVFLLLLSGVLLGAYFHELRIILAFVVVASACTFSFLIRCKGMDDPAVKTISPET